jgi:hypothetical protein
LEQDIKVCDLARSSISLLLDDSLNHDDYFHDFRLMVEVTSSLITLSVTPELAKRLWRQLTGMRTHFLDFV